MLQNSSKSGVFGCKGIECFVLAQRGMRPAAGNDTGSSGDRFLSIFERVKEIEQAAGFPGLKKTSNLLATFSVFFNIHFSLQNVLEFK
jgi:hypothetical protein